MPEQEVIDCDNKRGSAVSFSASGPEGICMIRPILAALEEQGNGIQALKEMLNQRKAPPPGIIK
jgi:hypothetical protein